MSLPIAVYSLSVKGTDVPAVEEPTDASIHLTMASIDANEKSNKATSLWVKVRPSMPVDTEDDEEMDEQMKELLEESQREFVLCTLKPGSLFQQPLNLTITPGDEVFFRTAGDATVHLSGNFLMNDEEEEHDHSDDEEDDEDYDLSPSEDDLVDTMSDEKNDDEDESEEDEEEEESEEDELDNAPAKKAEEPKKKRASQEETASPQKNENKKQKTEKPNKEKKVAFAEKLEQGPTGPAAKKEQQQEQKQQPKTRTLKGGVSVTDVKTGNGATATNGKKVEMRYIGKLENGKVFDKNTKGKPFAFLLGRGEVIRGWDIGVAGMSEGGERKIVIPAPMAYGNQSIPGIPKNSTLVFEVKLVRVH
ncbi:FKBP-type peptidyl-prolyl cis-trans isomerase [Schizosaccharomyces octosporus yFS286]|uniref:FK506-binding protein n=1 Tax=Schizosaccharomyces octosporus (strain yFS286) TaxID=483514 RepID=S9QY85_SCHOY|nr:FKBP-type peptidyl-prolyl cis-trans isomerase [Schizosaccharomyces octosporus yFS286]EPX71265.1 FKBP-type peptidyl-prolyl cis-trans isomerase [Schizosaccharomyces octosporus yFS286]